MHTLAKPLLYPDGRILVASTTQTAPYNDDAGYDYDATFFRFLPNGNLDSTFGVNGVAQPETVDGYAIVLKRRFSLAGDENFHVVSEFSKATPCWSFRYRGNQFRCH